MSGSSNSGGAWKVLQKRTYDILQQSSSLLLIFAGFVFIIVSAFHFGETWLEWSREKYEAMFNSFSDNVVMRSYQKQLCQYVPVDLVYTWVNGSDPYMLEELKRVKENLQDSLTETVTECSYKHCVASHILAIRTWLPESVKLSDVKSNVSALRTVHELKRVTLADGTSSQNKSFLIFQSVSDARVASANQLFLMVGGQNYSLHQTYWTSEWSAPNAFSSERSVILTGAHAGLDSTSVHQKLPKEVQPMVEDLWLYPEKSQAVITLATQEAADEFLKLNQNFTLDGKDTQLKRAYLIIGLSKFRDEADFSSNRYEDKEELRYSLRSVEKFAPWIRHIYLVTNGQIPHWLNLDNPHLTIVTHEQIFPNHSHLPTFGSPAIESHLHRIPGLSDKFLYLNDDVMFGKQIWPEDFYTHARGQKVYLSWPVPECREGCPNSWISDGYCDKSCNNTDCMWDGGDCKSEKRWSGQPGGPDSALDQWQTDMEKGVCAVNCVNSWLADKYCDTNCNNVECGFDAGDCGTAHYSQLLQMNFELNQTSYILPQGVTVAYWNLTELLTSMEVMEGNFEDSAVVRVAAVATKFKVLTLILYPQHNTTTIQMQLKGKVEDNEKEINFTVTVNTVHHKEKLPPSSARISSNTTWQSDAVTSTESPVVFQTFPEWEQRPALLKKHEEADDDMSLDLYYALNTSASGFPGNIARQVQNLFQLYMDGELTKKGYLVKKRSLIRDYIALLKQQGDKPPPFKYDTVIKRPGNTSFVPQSSTDGTLAAGAVEQVLLSREEKKKMQTVYMARKQNSRDQGGMEPGIQPRENVEKKQESLKVLKNSVMQNLLRGGYKKAVRNGVRTVLQYKKGLDAADKDFLQKEALNTYSGFLPWEKEQLLQKADSRSKASVYSADVRTSRYLLDTFADSLLHVNRLFNEKFGYEARKVPAHMPHFIDRHIMAELQDRFSSEWEATSSHRIRSPTDMQFSFSYFYFLMSELMPFDAGQKFDEFDTDGSGTLSDREIRTLLAQLYEPPLTYSMVQKFEDIIVNCSQCLPPELSHGIPTPLFERYADSKLPTVSRQLMLQCPPVVSILKQKYHKQKKYKFEIVGEEEVTFTMLSSNLSHVVGLLDDIRRQPRKFICINDNMDPKREKDNIVVQAILQDFYESLFPIASSFELPPEYRNRFLYVSELQQWRVYRNILKAVTYLCLIVLIVFSLTSFFQSQMTALQRKFCPRRRQKSLISKEILKTEEHLLKEV